MRKAIKRISVETLYEALKLLHYSSLRKDNSEWRRQQFHLFIRKRGKPGIALSIHEDTPSAFPPFHRARHKSKALEVELAKIEEAYHRKRATKK